jgi:hypothetical protein
MDYQDLFDCTDCTAEFDDLPDTQVFTIFYSRHLLYTSIIAPNSGEALTIFNRDEAHLLDFEVG